MPSKRVNASSARCATRNRHGWLLLADGAQRAASSSASTERWSSSWSASSPRGLHRCASWGWIGTDVAAVFCAVMVCGSLSSDAAQQRLERRRAAERAFERIGRGCRRAAGDEVGELVGGALDAAGQRAVDASVAAPVLGGGEDPG